MFIITASLARASAGERRRGRNRNCQEGENEKFREEERNDGVKEEAEEGLAEETNMRSEKSWANIGKSNQTDLKIFLEKSCIFISKERDC